MKLVLGLDPSWEEGGTTGVVTWDGKRFVFENLSGDDYVVTQRLTNIIKNYDLDCVYCESYEITQAGSHKTKELIGIIKYICHEHKVKLVMTPASKSKYFWTDERLVEEGVFELRGRTYLYENSPVKKHCRDAVRQVLTNEIHI